MACVQLGVHHPTKAFSGKLLSSWAAHSTNWCLGLFHPRAGCALVLLTFTRPPALHPGTVPPASPGPSGPPLCCILSTSQPCPLGPNRHAPSAYPGTTLCQARPLCTTDHCTPRTVPNLATPSKPRGLWHFPAASLPSQSSAQMGWEGLSRDLATDIQAMLCIKRKALGIAAHHREKCLRWSTHENK